MTLASSDKTSPRLLHFIALIFRDFAGHQEVLNKFVELLIPGDKIEEKSKIPKLSIVIETVRKVPVIGSDLRYKSANISNLLRDIYILSYNAQLI